MTCNQIEDFSTETIRKATNREAKNQKQADLQAELQVLFESAQWLKTLMEENVYRVRAGVPINEIDFKCETIRQRYDEHVGNSSVESLSGISKKQKTAGREVNETTSPVEGRITENRPSVSRIPRKIKKINNVQARTKDLTNGGRLTIDRGPAGYSEIAAYEFDDRCAKSCQDKIKISVTARGRPLCDCVLNCTTKEHGDWLCTNRLGQYDNPAQLGRFCDELTCGIFRRSGKKSCGNWIEDLPNNLALPCLQRCVSKNKALGRYVTTSSIISKGTIVGVYLGVITMGDLNAYDDNIAYENGDRSIYGARLTHATDAHPVVVDARVKGNISRFINHDCKPNCEFVIWNMNDERALVVITLEPIPEYAQLTVNYGTADPTFLCLCETCIHQRANPNYRKPDKIKLKLNRSMDSVYLPSVFWNHQNKTSSLISVLMAFSTTAISSNSVCAGLRSSTVDVDKVSEIFHSLRDQLHTEPIVPLRLLSAIRHAFHYLVAFLSYEQEAIVETRDYNFTKYALYVLVFTALKKLMPSPNDPLSPQLIMSILFPEHDDITWIPTNLLRSYQLNGLHVAKVAEEQLNVDISVTRPTVMTISIKSTREPQSIVEELQFTVENREQRIDKTYKSTTIKLTYKLRAITFSELEQQHSPDLTQFKTFVKCQKGKDIWYEISHEGEQHVPHGNLVTRHEVVSPMLNCFCSKLRSMFKETTTTSSSSSSSSSRSSSSSKRAAVLYYCKQ
jgi:hypothetical protein